MRRFLGCLFIVCFVFSCTPPIPKEPKCDVLPESWKAPLPETHKDSETLAVSNDPLFNTTNLRWWEVFHNEDLNNLIAKAFSDNFTLKTYFSRLEEAYAAAGITFADLFPQISFNGVAARERVAKDQRQKFPVVRNSSIAIPPISITSVPSTVTPEAAPFTPTTSNCLRPKYLNDLTVELLLSYEVDLWGKYRMAYGASKERISESQDDYRAARLSLSSNIAITFYKMLYLRTVVELIRHEIELYDQLVGIGGNRFGYGLLNEDQLLTYKNEREAAIEMHYYYKTQLELAINQLAIFAGLPPETYTPPTYPLEMVYPPLPTEVSSTIILQRPDIRSLQAELRARALEVGVAEADNLPSFTIGCGAGFASTKSNSLFKWKNHIWSLDSAINYVLFDAGKKRSIIELNKAIFKESLYAFEERVLEALQEVENALFSLHGIEKSLKHEQTRHGQFVSLVNLAQDRYDRGLASKSEYVQALVNLLEEELVLSQKEQSYLSSAISFFTAIGGLWDNPKITP